MSYHEKIRVGVLRGGASSEYEYSLESGAAAIAHLAEPYQPIDIFIDRAGIWHLHGRAEEPHRILRKVDVIFNALHGRFGEDGRVQEILVAHGVSFSGPRRLAAALSLNKALTKKILSAGGVQTPQYKVIHRDATYDKEILGAMLFRSFPQPSLVKPIVGGASMGISIARTPEEIAYALELAFIDSSAVMIEEYIEGREAVCGVIEKFRNEPVYSLLPAEVHLASGTTFFDTAARRNLGFQITCPGNFEEATKAELRNAALLAHRLLGLRHYSSSEFIVHKTRGTYFIETDALPHLADSTPFRVALSAVGASLSSFLHHTLSLALEKK